MDKFSNSRLTSNLPITKAFKELNIYSFEEASEYLKYLPYHRISNRNDFSLVLYEKHGTCSSKHALLKTLAIENNFNEINLCIGIYKMNASNTKGIGTVIKEYGLDYIPEAHTYLKINASIIDITGIDSKESNFYDSLINEEYILPDQVGDYKVLMHQDFIKQWIIKNSIPYDFETIWDIREQCIANLSS